MIPSSTSQRASLATRSTLSATVPSFSWKTIWPSFGPPGLERDLEVLFPEEAGVGQAGGQHFLVAGDDALAAVRRGDVGDADEGGARVRFRAPAQAGAVAPRPHGSGFRRSTD
jgi:hypothetical protein